MSTDNSTIEKSIRYNRETKDYDCYLSYDDAEHYLGSRGNYSDAEILCNQVYYDMLEDGLVGREADLTPEEQDATAPSIVLSDGTPVEVVMEPNGSGPSGVLAADALTVASYIGDLAEQRYKVATITRRLASISQAHLLAGHPSPTQHEQVRTVLKGIRRTLGTAQTAKTPATTDVIKLLLAQLPGELLGTRDRALLLLGFAGAFRRSELVSLDVADVAFERQGMRITLRHSKTDQERQGTVKAIPYGLLPATCPVRALQAWLASAAITTGPVFRPLDRHGNVKAQRLSAQSVALVVKRYAKAAGLQVEDFSGHSLRAGLATSAAAAGVSERKIMQQTGHKSVQMVRRYIRESELFSANAAGAVGL